ncbi:hypothetical protein FNH06_23140 [Amycolatopsis acidiphila]|uniref:Uncharacterized protein n=1 Tax=Amycolatopsis acidiphila TaxID=715473 RepID=A0A558A693_9PSEU|nr:hypothetical protein FNH06_23140 [Amycolatopsis acidiphila]
MEVWHTPKQSWVVLIVGVLVRWRAEILIVSLVVAGRIWLGHEVGPMVAWLIFGGVAFVIVVIPPSRRFAYGRFWCLVDRHRLRTCLRQARARTMNLDGALPFMLWARPTKTGERVWLWSRAGSSSGDIEEALEYIAPACFARDARLHKVRKLSTLFAVDVIRRDPLDKSTPLGSPLGKLGSLLGGRGIRESAEPITGATITPLPVKPREKKTDRPAVVNGDDLSDYID